MYAKTTTFDLILPRVLAAEMSAFQAGRIMLQRLHYLAKKRVDSAFETSLASRSFALWINELRKAGYEFHLVFLWLPNADFAIARVSERVRRGGHTVLEETIRRRWRAGLRNFFDLYRLLSDTWRFYDNSDPAGPRLIACGQAAGQENVLDVEAWTALVGEYNHGKKI